MMAKKLVLADPKDLTFITWVPGRSPKATQSIALWWDCGRWKRLLTKRIIAFAKTTRNETWP